MSKTLLFILLVSILISCGSDRTNTETGAWFGGEIINPNTTHVILTRNEKVLDTILLDRNNRFLHYIENVEKGIYKFIHNEYQILYLEPGDSLMIRLNTIEFDESLAFTGRGSERNNLLINMFLHNEQENQRMRPFYQLPVEDFIQKLDSMRDMRFENLERFIDRYKPCKEFYKVAEANILYDYYAKRELYPYAYYGRNNITEAQLPEDYYDFRKGINYNSKTLQSYYTYYRFMLWHFDHLAYETYFEKLPYKSESLTHITNKLKAIDSLVKVPKLKNSLLRTSIRSYIINCKNPDKENEAMALYLDLSTDEAHKEEMKKISEASLKLMPGNDLPQLTMYNFDGDRVVFSNIIKRPTVLYFWSVNSVNHLRNVHSKVDELKQKYPEFDFIALNTNDDKKSWKQIITRHGFDKNYEFRFLDPEKAVEHLVINTINKTMIIDKKGKIIDNHTNLFSVKFEEELLGFLNQ